MFRYALALLLSLSLLTQVGAAAWAAPAAATTTAEVETTTPPCHGAAEVAKQAAAPEAAMPCCGDADSCQCLIGCATVTALVPRPYAAPLYARAHFDHPRVRPAPLPAHPQPLLRPPTILRES